jgi:hypothetical protein
VAEDPDVPEVRPPTIGDLRRICAALESAGARCALIGGFGLHGGERTTKGIDLVRVADEVMVDLLGAACGVTWAEARGSAMTFDLDGSRVLVADRKTLIRTKQTPRPSDAADRAWLEALGEDDA